MFMIDLLSREASWQRLRLLGDDSETNRALGYFPFAFSPSSTSRRMASERPGMSAVGRRLGVISTATGLPKVNE
jgi:hypothetical protein